MTTIEKHVPLAPVKTGQGPRRRAFKYPWNILRVTGSFFVPEAKADAVGNQATQYNAKLYPKRFKTRKVEGGRRVWRVLWSSWSTWP